MKKRMLALLAVLCCVALVAALFVACNNGEEGQTDNNTGVTTPADDDAQQGAETPDDEGQGGETTDPDDEQGGDTQDPADPDEGEEDPDEDIEEPETPDEDEGGEENPPIEDEKDPFVIDTLDELLEYKSKTTYDFFYDNYMQSVVTKLAGRSATLNNAEQIEWEITATEGDTITELQVRFVYHKDDGGYWYYVGTVVPTEAITVNDILTGNTQELSRRNILRVYSANTIEADMEQNRPLAEAIVTELGGTINDGDHLLVSMDTTSTDPELHEVRAVRVKQITETGVNEYQVTIAAPGGHGDIETLLNSLANEEYNKVDIKIAVTFGEGVVIDGTQADVEVPEFEEQ